MRRESCCRCVMSLYMYIYIYIYVVCVCVCAFFSSTAVCARENTALYSQKPGFWLLKNLSFLFFFLHTKTKKGKEDVVGIKDSTNDDDKKTTIIQKLLPSRASKNLETSRLLKILILLYVCVYVCVSNIQSAALKWSALRYKWQPDMQRDTNRNKKKKKKPLRGGAWQSYTLWFFLSWQPAASRTILKQNGTSCGVYEMRLQ